MSRATSIVSIIVITAFLSGCEPTKQEILDKTISKLNSLETVEYKMRMQIVRKEMNYSSTDSAQCYFDFTSEDTLLGSRFQFSHKFGEVVFNGKQLFRKENIKQHIVYNTNPHRKSLHLFIFMKYSFYELQQVLPEFNSTKSVDIESQKDTSINDIPCYQFHIKSTKYIKYGHLMEGYGDTMNYHLAISKKHFIPILFSSVNPDNQLLKATFANINVDASRPESTWNRQRFPEKFLRISRRELKRRQQQKRSQTVGSQAPDWQLLGISKDTARLSDFRGNPVLLEFWFPYCSGCEAAIPHMNDLNERYRDKGLKVFGIEFTKDDPAVLENYIKENDIDYPVLYKGEEVANKYGVTAGPTVYIINREGKIIYTRAGFREQEVKKVINKLM